MTLQYIILSCPQYEQTRQQWQRETWLRWVDYVYLDGSESYKEAPLKYVRYLRSADLTHDWYFFCDDDTFVYDAKLRLLCIGGGNTMTGFRGGEFSIYNLRISWCSGGAGVLLAGSLVRAIQKHLQNTGTPIITDETDISLAIWANMCGAQVVDNKRFSPFKPAETPHCNDCITYHYCDWKDFQMLNQNI